MGCISIDYNKDYSLGNDCSHGDSHDCSHGGSHGGSHDYSLDNNHDYGVLFAYPVQFLVLF